ncbi:MAG TPA: hypothetical protein DCZ91_23860 [Lachnospiraceae bacterium]|nr:hypothetical protein [Lachnospiraceae bacterium]
MKTGAGLKKKICAVTLMLPLLISSCGARDNPDSVSVMEEKESESTQAAGLQSQEGNDGSDTSADSEAGITAVADYYYIEMNSAVSSSLSTNKSYAINREWIYMTDFIKDEEKSLEYERGIYDYGITRKRIADGYQDMNYIVTGVDDSNHNRPLLLADREGNCYIFWRFYNWEEEANTYRLDKYDTDGELLWRQEPTEEDLEGMGEQLEQGTLDREGRVILYSCGEGCAFRFGEDGSLEGSYRPGLESLDGVAVGQDDRAYGYCISGKETVFAELGGTGKTYVCPVDSFAVYDGYEEGVCLATQKGMFACEPETGEVRQLWNWSDEYVLLDADKLDKVFQDGGAFTVLCEFSDATSGYIYNRQLATLACVTFEDSREYPAKQTVTLAMDDTSRDFTGTLVKLYNRQSRKYRVKIAVVGDGEALQARLMRGGDTDLADVSQIYTEDLARLGVFEDLDPYYEKSRNVAQEDILGSVREACTVAGKNVTVIPGFELYTMRARGDFVKADEWTVWKFLEMGQENRVLTSQTPGMALNICMGVRYGEHFIDYENKTCSFDGEEFRRILESCGKWITQIEYSGGGMIESSTRKGDWLFDHQFINGPADIVWQDIDSDEAYNYEGEEYSSTLVGFPGWEGGEGRFNAFSIFAINSSSQNKEGAWDFLEYMLSEELQAKLEPMLDQFPARRDCFEAYLRDDYEDPKRYGWVTASEEDITRIQEMAETAVLNNLGNAYNQVAVIVSEEADMYFAGADLDTTVDKIQSRVQLYLDEL